MYSKLNKENNENKINNLNVEEFDFRSNSGNNNKKEEN